MSKISVIVPIYNAERFLRQCIDSIVNQTCRDLEIILVNDGSTDNCGAICDEYAVQDDRIRVIHKQNGGITTALNAGLEFATGEWVAFCDADDWLDADYYEHMLSTMKPGILSDIHFSQGYYTERVNSPAEVSYVCSDPVGVASGAQKELLLVRTLINVRGQNGWMSTNGFYWNKLYRQAFLRANGLHLATGMAAKGGNIDALFNFQALCKAEIVTGGGTIGYHYRQVNGSCVHRYNEYLTQAYVEYLHEINELAQDHGMTVDLRQAIYASAIWGVAACLKSIFCPANADSKTQKTGRIKELKTEPIMHEAIWSSNNRYLSYKRVILKYALRLPWVWPLKMLYCLNNVEEQKKNSTLY